MRPESLLVAHLITTPTAEPRFRYAGPAIVPITDVAIVALTASDAWQELHVAARQHCGGGEISDEVAVVSWKRGATTLYSVEGLLYGRGLLPSDEPWYAHVVGVVNARGEIVRDFYEVDGGTPDLLAPSLLDADHDGYLDPAE